MFQVRVIKSEGCFKCKNYLKILTAQKYSFVIYDADLPENQKQLDDWKIDAMPVVQIIDQKNDGTTEIVFQFAPGRWSTRSIDAKISELKKEKSK